MRTGQLKDEMNVVAVEVQKTVKAGRKAGLSNDAAALAALIGIISVIRVDGLNEEALLSEARKAVPRKMPGDGIMHITPH